MGAKNTKDDLDPQRDDTIAKLLKNKKINEDFIRDIEEFQKQRKLRAKQLDNQNTINNNNNNPTNDTKIHDIGKSYYKNEKPLAPLSRLQIDINDPLLIATLPPHLTSVFTENTERHQYAIPAIPPLPHNNTFNAAKLQNINHEYLEKNYTDPWRYAAYKMAQNNVAAMNHKLNNKPTRSLLLQELLECPICMNRYENPHVLPCQHTFCKTCISSLKSSTRNDSTKIIQCPICRETHDLPGGVDSLPANYTMKRLIELEIMAAEKEAAAELAGRTKRKPHIAKKIVKSNSSFSSNQSTATLKYISKYHKHKKEYSSHYTDHEQISNENHLKLILLCHSSALDTLSELNTGNYSSEEHNYDRIDNNSSSSVDSPNAPSRKKEHQRSMKTKQNEIYEDEYGKCKTFSKIGVRYTDHIEKIKNIVQQKFQIPYCEQLLVYKDKILKHDHKQLKAYHVRNYSRIHVFDKRDVKENLDDIDPYSIDQDFVEELANSFSIPKLSQNIEAERASLRDALDSDIYASRKSISKNKAPPGNRQSKHKNSDTYEEISSPNHFIYERNFSKPTKYSMPDIRKHSVSGRRVRRLDELLDSSLMYRAK